MERYISERHAQEAMSTLICDCIRDKKIPTYDDVANALLTCPTADVVEVKHGKWIKTEGRYSWHCSLCKVDDQFAYCWNREKGDYDFQDNYCPSCGARMNGE